MDEHKHKWDYVLPRVRICLECKVKERRLGSVWEMFKDGLNKNGH
jgi:hypothetical protein